VRGDAKSGTRKEASEKARTAPRARLQPPSARVSDAAGHLGAAGGKRLTRSAPASRLGAAPRPLEDADCFALAFEHGSIPMKIVALDGRLLRANGAFCRWLGYTERELRRLSLLDVTHPDERNAVSDYLRRAAKGDLPSWQVEKRYLRKDGRTISGLVSTSLVRAGGDAPAWLIAQVQDISKRKRAEAQLAYQVNLLENVNDAVIAADANFALTVWNHAAEAMYGWTADEVLGRPATEVPPAEFIAGEGSKTRRALLEAGQWTGELVQARRDGAPICVEAKAIALRDEAGAISSFVSVNRDISDRKRTEDALRASEERFRLLIENASDIIMIVNADGTFRYLSPAHERRVFGYFHPADLPAVISAFRAVAQRPGVGPATEFRVRHCDGSWRVIEAIGNNQLENPGIQGVVINARDISQRKRAEDALRYRLDFERLLAEISTNFINLPPAEIANGVVAALKAIGEFFGIDRGYIVSFAAKGTMQLEYEWCAHGTAPLIGEFRDVPIDNYPWWRDRRQRLEPVHVVRVDDLPEEGAGKHYLTSQGTQSIIEVPMVSGGALFAVLGLSSRSQRGWTEDDVTLLKMAGEMFLNALQHHRAEHARVELEQRLLQLQKLEAVGRLASGVAHDFNNQLTIIKGCAQFLLVGVAPDDPLRKDAERINATVDRGAQLVRQLLAFNSEQPTEPQRLDVNQLVVETVPMLHLLLGEQIVLTTTLAASLWPVRADPVQIERVILNLVINAKDAIPESRDEAYVGRVTIETANVDPAMTFSVSEGPPVPGAYVMVSVGDNGCGMTPEVRERIFEPYFTTKPFGKGTGLGLSTAFGVVKQHGGYISCVTEPGGGATFRVFLPKERGETSLAAGGENALQHVGTEAGPPAEPSPRPPNATVLVAEDEEAVREMIRDVLENAGYRVHVATGVDEALTVAARLAGRLDLLVTDVAMPGGSGNLLARRLVLDNPVLRVLFISGYPHKWVESAGMPPSRFLQKPFSMDTLLQRAEEILRE
jgi:PAS domain S-box-containing protein